MKPVHFMRDAKWQLTLGIIFSASRKAIYEYGCHDILTFKVQGKLYFFSINNNPNGNTGTYYCLLTSMAAIHESVTRASLLSLEK